MSFILPMIFIFPFLAAFISFFIGRKSERACGLFSVISCGITLVLTIICIFTSYGSSFEILGYSLVFEGFHAVYAAISAFMWFCSALISPKYFEGHGKTRGYYFFFLLTEGALLGMFISADLFTVFVFFEMMSFASYTWVTHEKTEKAMAAGRTYLTVSVIGGMAMLMGLFMLYTITGTLEIYSLYDAVCAAGKSTKLYISAFLMLCGFGAKAGLFPLHIWLPKAHPVAPAPASALLSGVLTKAGVFGIIVITGQILRHDRIWGLTLLVLALITMVLGAVLALMSIDLKRVLACSSLSQIGFILVGVSMIALLGEENFLAANGTFLYMINHSLVKLVLFLSAGAIYMKAHTLDINRLRGFGRKKPLLAAVFLVGASSLSGLPGFCGYISKTLVHESIVEFSVSAGIIGNIIEWLFLISGGFTLAYMIKLFVAIFIEKPCEEHEKSKISTVVYTSLVISALSLIPFGLFPHAISEKVISFMLPLSSGGEFEERIDYFSFKNLSGILISIAIGVAVYFLIVRMLLMKKKDGVKIYISPLPERISMENLFYIPIGKALIFAISSVFRALDALPELIIKAGMTVLSFICRVANDITDAFVLVMRKTLFRDSPERTVHKKHRLAHALGEMADKRHDDTEKKTENHLVRISETLSRTTSRIFGSFSFALFMICFGICVILLFMIINF